MNYLETLKNISKDKNKKIEFIIFMLVISIIILYSLKYVFKENTYEEKSIQTLSSNISSQNENIEEKLSNILSKIEGISDVSVALTYTNNGSSTPVYNTKEIVNQTQTTTEKNVAYNEDGGNKVAVIQTSILPNVEGAIVVAHGTNDANMKSKIANAVATCVGIPVYKVQVFEKN